MYNFATLDPRNVPAAAEANDRVFAGSSIYGIEVTVSALAERCTFNLDPQHSGGDASRAAIEDAVTVDLPAEGSTLTTVRADLDAVGSMAIFSLRAKGESLESAMDRINMVATSDKFARGGYPGPKPLPTRENQWDESSATAESSRSLAAIAAAVMDFKVSLADRVSTMEQWLLTGDEPAQYRTQVEKERLDMITAMETGKIKSETRSGGRIAVVEGTHRAATSVGYSLARLSWSRSIRSSGKDHRASHTRSSRSASSRRESSRTSSRLSRNSTNSSPVGAALRRSAEVRRVSAPLSRSIRSSRSSKSIFFRSKSRIVPFRAGSP